MKHFFEGWYFKQQCGDFSIAFIPSYHVDKNKNKTCFLQIILSDISYNIPFSFSTLKVNKKNFNINLDGNNFSKDGISLYIDKPDIKIVGSLFFKNLTPLKYDIMGPLNMLPFLECKHGIISMKHDVYGYLNINGKEIKLDNGTGYIEKDFGCSFPHKYMWTQCTYNDTSISCAAATIPYLGMKFTGFFCVINTKNIETRLSSYLMGKILHFSENKLILKQGSKILTIEKMCENVGQNLNAPTQGVMNRIIKENLNCKVKYTLHDKKQKLLEIESDKASFEFSINE